MAKVELRWNYIARDSDNTLFVYTHRPTWREDMHAFVPCPDEGSDWSEVHPSGDIETEPDVVIEQHIMEKVRAEECRVVEIFVETTIIVGALVPYRKEETTKNAE
jgi:hypothetical protein